MPRFYNLQISLPYWLSIGWRNILAWLPLTYGSLQLKLHEKCFSLLCRTCFSSINPAQFQFETYAHIFVSFLCSTVFSFLFSVFCFLGNQGNFDDKRIANWTNELCQLAVVLLIVICCKCTCLSHTRAGCKEHIRVPFMCVLLCVYFKVLWSLLWVWLVVCNIAYAQFQLCPTTFISLAPHMASWSDL